MTTCKTFEIGPFDHFRGMRLSRAQMGPTKIFPGRDYDRNIHAGTVGKSGLLRWHVPGAVVHSLRALEALSPRAVALVGWQGRCLELQIYQEYIVRNAKDGIEDCLINQCCW